MHDQSFFLLSSLFNSKATYVFFHFEVAPLLLVPKIYISFLNLLY